MPPPPRAKRTHFLKKRHPRGLRACHFKKIGNVRPIIDHFDSNYIQWCPCSQTEVSWYQEGLIKRCCPLPVCLFLFLQRQGYAPIIFCRDKVPACVQALRHLHYPSCKVLAPHPLKILDPPWYHSYGIYKPKSSINLQLQFWSQKSHFLNLLVNQDAETFQVLPNPTFKSCIPWSFWGRKP